MAPNSEKPIPATNAGIATWYRRSSMQSELRETKNIAASPIRLGIVSRSPTTLLEYRPESDFHQLWSPRIPRLKTDHHPKISQN